MTTKNKKENKKFKLLPFGKLVTVTDKMPKMKTVWAGIKEGSFGYIVGPGKSGKSTFGENFALSVAVGRKTFWGKKLFDGIPHKVLFISFEENCLPRVERAKKQIAGLTDDEKELINVNYFQPDCDFQQSLTSDTDWKHLKDAIKKSKAKIVFIDSLSRLYAGAIEESQTAQKVLLKLRKLSRELDITLIVIHHVTKLQGRIMTMDSVAGSRFISQEADFCIGINKGTDDRRYLKELFYRYEKQSDNIVQQFYIGDDLWLKPTEKTHETKLFEKQDGRTNTNNLLKVKECIDDVKDEDYLFSTKELVKRLVNTGVMAKNTLYSQIKKLIADNSIKKKGEGLYILIQTGKEVSDEK